MSALSPSPMEAPSNLPLLTSLPSATFTADTAGVAARPVTRSLLHRRVPSKYDPVICDVAILLQLKGFASPDRWSGIKDCAENPMTEGGQHVGVKVEKRLSRHAEFLKDAKRANARTPGVHFAMLDCEEHRDWCNDRIQEKFREHIVGDPAVIFFREGARARRCAARAAGGALYSCKF